MDKKPETPISQMDDHDLQLHALGLAYRDAERRREEAESRVEKLERDYRDLEEQMKEMTAAYQAVMKKNAALSAGEKRLKAELETLRKSRPESARKGE